MNGVTQARLIQLMVGREVATVFPKRTVPIGETMLEVTGLSASSVC